MAEILELSDGGVKVGTDDGKTKVVPIASVQFANPQVGDQVKVYADGNNVIVKRDGAQADSTNGTDDRRRVNKVLYVVLTFFFAPLGVQRFMRGQIGLGLLMLLVGWWATLGIWPLVDFIISLVKLGSFKGDDYVFTPDGRWTA